MRFQATKLSKKRSAILQERQFADVQENRFRAVKRQLLVCSPASVSISYFAGNAFSGCETFKYEQFHPACESISWCSGIDFSSLGMVRYGQRYVARGSFCWCSEIAFSGCQTFKYGQCNYAELLILRNLVFMLRSGEIWAALSCKRVD